MRELGASERAPKGAQQSGRGLRSRIGVGDDVRVGTAHAPPCRSPLDAGLEGRQGGHAGYVKRRGAAPPEIVCDLAADRRRPGGGGAISAATGGAT